MECVLQTDIPLENDALVKDIVVKYVYTTVHEVHAALVTQGDIPRKDLLARAALSYVLDSATF